MSFAAVLLLSLRGRPGVSCKNLNKWPASPNIQRRIKSFIRGHRMEMEARLFSMIQILNDEGSESSDNEDIDEVIPYQWVKLYSRIHTRSPYDIPPYLNGSLKKLFNDRSPGALLADYITLSELLNSRKPTKPEVGWKVELVEKNGRMICPPWYKRTHNVKNGNAPIPYSPPASLAYTAQRMLPGLSVISRVISEVQLVSLSPPCLFTSFCLLIQYIAHILPG
jgi:hypothetical protein